MGNMEDALKKAGLAEGEESPEPPSAAEGSVAATEAPSETSVEPVGEVSAESDTPTPSEPAAEPKEEPCAQCGTLFMAKHPRHRLCEKCAAERQSARIQAKPVPRPDAKPASADRGPAPTGETRACAKCGTVFSPRQPRHRMCDKCAAEAPPREPRVPRESRPLGESRPFRESRPAPEVPRTPAQTAPRPVRRDPPRETTPVRRAPAPVAGVPHDYLAGGYFGGRAPTHLRDELFLDWAQQWADLLVQRRLSSAQMRAFYNHVRRAAASLQAGGDAQQARARLLRIPGFAAARVGRPGFPLEFREFLDRNVEQVKDAATLQAFAEHFQAVLGFTSGRLRN